MASIEQEARVSPEELFKAVKKLSATELQDFVQQVLRLQAQQEEAELLLKIREPRPPQFQKRYNALIRKRRADTLTSEEYEELLGLTEQAEAFDVRRVERLTKLAQLRGKSLPDLMQELGIPPPKYV